MCFRHTGHQKRAFAVDTLRLRRADRRTFPADAHNPLSVYEDFAFERRRAAAIENRHVGEYDRAHLSPPDGQIATARISPSGFCFAKAASTMRPVWLRWCNASAQ
jgi:hypothetical protein